MSFKLVISERFVIKERNAHGQAVTRCSYIHESRAAEKCTLLQLTVQLLARLVCSSSHTVGKISHNRQVLRMDCTV